MARLTAIPWQKGSLSDLNNPRLIVVDMINGFTKEGALADSAIAAAAKPIERLVQEIGAENSLFVTDCHQPGCMEFDAFPEHCVEGTKESQVMDELAGYVRHILKKNSINTFTAPGFDEWLKELPEVCDIVITGCCTDLCVLQLALSLQSWIHQNDQKQKRVFIPVDCVDTYNIPNVHDACLTNAFALNNMAANGIQIVSAFSKDGN